MFCVLTHVNKPNSLILLLKSAFSVNASSFLVKYCCPVIFLLISVLEIAFLMYKRFFFFFFALVVYGQVFWPFYLFPVVGYIASGDVSQKGTLLVLMKQLRSK